MTMNIIVFTDYIAQRIAEHRQKMQVLMQEARLLVDIAVYEHEQHIKTDFGKIAQAKDYLTEATKHSKEIKRLEKTLHKDRKKA